MKGAVASGHPLTSKAAVEMLAAGGNAFDAVVSAGFASAVTEPTLTSLGGGGFLLAHIKKEKKNILFDFFVNTPGLESAESIKPAMNPVEIKFPGCTQVFHTGFGSAAVPGTLKGLLYIHERLCTLPIETVLKPALVYLKEGVEINSTQEVFLDYLKPIFTLDAYGKDSYLINNRYVRKHDIIRNPLLNSFLKDILRGGTDIYRGGVAQKLVERISKEGGAISGKDLASYRVIEREPLCVKYRDREILVNPPPSFGGIMLALSLKLIENIDLPSLRHGSEEYLISLIELMKDIMDFRSKQKGEWTDKAVNWSDNPEVSRLIQNYLKNISGKTVISTAGTTHISVIDKEGNAASMTTSNGSGSGQFIPGTGVMINNMMGEDDLHPDGFFETTPGKRVSSMMAPTIIIKKGEVEAVMGSGGSKRIRTAILQVLLNIIDFGYPLREAIEAPRIHFEEGIVQAEPDIPEDILESLKKHYKINVWGQKNMYFGGVHVVNNILDGWGDSRRGGNFLRSV
jgi:gamma-glutamyltranspeptidase/glutathione hydrolase